MTIIQAIILGIVQGSTEFIPVSSSGHLVLVPHLLGWEFNHSQAFVFDVLVQWGTLFAVFIYYRQDLTAIGLEFGSTLLTGKPFTTEKCRMGWYLILATIQAVIVGLFCKDLIESVFSNAKMPGILLFVIAALLIIAELAELLPGPCPSGRHWYGRFVAQYFSKGSAFGSADVIIDTTGQLWLGRLNRMTANRCPGLLHQPMIAETVSSASLKSYVGSMVTTLKSTDHESVLLIQEHPEGQS